uniref:Uncharacterized protein n=1 Tax=Ciona intestinalis TaxID=7719 RepID=H2XRC9_CIOIN
MLDSERKSLHSFLVSPETKFCKNTNLHCYVFFTHF